MSIRTNYQAQQTDRPPDLSRADNAHEQVQGNYGRANDLSRRVWAAAHIGWYRHWAAVIVLALAAAVGGTFATLWQGRRRGGWGELSKARDAWRRRRKVAESCRIIKSRRGTRLLQLDLG